MHPGIARMPDLEWQTFEAGYCRHPEISVRRDGRWKSCEFPALVFLVRHPQQGCLLFDTGYSHHFLEATRRMPERLYTCVTPVTLPRGGSMKEQLAARGMAPADIRHVFVSHFHGDHIGGLPDFPGAQIFCARAGWQDMAGRSRFSRVRKGLLRELAPEAIAHRLCFIEDLGEITTPAEFAPFTRARDLFGDGSLLAIELPGHAPGHWGLAFRAAREWIFLLGDAAWSSAALRAGAPPPRLTTAFLGNTPDYRRTFEGLRRIALAHPNIRLVPSHCEEFRP